MKTRLIFLFCILAVASSSGLASAHEIPSLPNAFPVPHPPGDARAEDTDTTKETEVRALAAHWYWHFVDAGSAGADGLVEFRRVFRNDDRTWNSGSTFFILTNDLFRIIESAKSYDMGGIDILRLTDARGKEVFREGLLQQFINVVIQRPTPDQAICTDWYANMNDAVPRWVCSYRFRDFYLFAGFQAELEDLPEAKENAYSAFLRGWITAEDVAQKNDRETLKEFVDAVASIYAQLIQSNPGKFSPVMELQSVIDKEPWRSGNIYLFVLAGSGKVLFNGLDRSLEGVGLDLVDKDENNIADLITQTLTEGDGFFEYYWDDPSESGDEVRDAEGNPIPGQSPGTSFKVGYVRAVDASSLGLGNLIVGSGIYPGEGEDGCSIASSDAALGGGLLGLLMAASVLLLAVLGGIRSRRKIFPVIFFVLAAFSGFSSAVAHEIEDENVPTLQGLSHPEDAVKAEDVDPTNEEQVRDLAAHLFLHLVSGYENAVSLVNFRPIYRNDAATWNSGSMYLIFKTLLGPAEGTAVVIENTRDDRLDGRSLFGLRDATGKDILRGLYESLLQVIRTPGNPFNPRFWPAPFNQIEAVARTKDNLSRYAACTSYTAGPSAAAPRWACMYPFQDMVVIFGLDPRLQDLPEPKESGYEILLKERITAAEVDDRETLREFVDTVASIYELQVANSPEDSFLPLMRLQNAIGSEPWRSGNVYLFIMAAEDNKVLYNALDRSLEGRGLDLVDKDGNNIADLITQTLTEGDGFFEYYWDDPSESGDEVRDAEGNPIPGQSPGTSFKVGYVRSIEIPAFPGGWIVGSGIYPEESTGSDGGCSVARSGIALGSAALNLFLIVSVLLLPAVLRRSRTDSGQM